AASISPSLIRTISGCLRKSKNRSRSSRPLLVPSSLVGVHQSDHRDLSHGSGHALLVLNHNLERPRCDGESVSVLTRRQNRSSVGERGTEFSKRKKRSISVRCFDQHVLRQFLAA